MTNYVRLPFLILAILALLVGLATGLSRMGWGLNMLDPSLHHGAIMVGGFLGTLISLEKVIPLKKKLLLLIPATSGSSVVFFLAGCPAYSFVALLVSAFFLALVFLYYLMKTKDLIYFLMLCGSLCWLAGNALLISRAFYPAVFPWWLGFILFIITSERLELTKFLPVSKSEKGLLVGLLFLYAVGIIWSFHAGGQWISGTALIAVAVWLMKNDIVGVSIKKSGLQKFIAIALLSGYVAMLLTGIFLMTLMTHVFGYDAILHTFFLGFAFSMIFAHGPVILPGILGITAKPWHPIMYLWLVILHGSLATRILADLVFNMQLRKLTGIATSVAILGYFVTMAMLTLRHQRLHGKVL